MEDPQDNEENAFDCFNDIDREGALVVVSSNPSLVPGLPLTDIIEYL